MRIAAVDFSWIFHMHKHAMMDLSYQSSPDEAPIPTGHVYGTLKFIQRLVNHYDKIILALDSPRSRYQAIHPTYKHGRHAPTGDKKRDYNIFQDLWAVIDFLTITFPNVVVVKLPEYEADHIIQSLIHYSQPTADTLACFFSDNDILTVRGDYTWFNNIREPVFNRQAYISKKYGLDLDYVPVIYSAVRGQSSDNYEASLPRFPSSDLNRLALQIPYSENWDYEFNFLTITSDQYLSSLSPANRKNVEELKSTTSHTAHLFARNFELASPIIIPQNELVLLPKTTRTQEEAQYIISSKFGINTHEL